MMARLLFPLKALLLLLPMCLACRAVLGQSCQTLTLTNLQPAGTNDPLGTFGFSLQYAGGPLDEFDSLYTDDVIYLAGQASATFDLAYIFNSIGKPTGFPKGSYTLTVSFQEGYAGDSPTVQVSVGSGLSLQNGSTQTVGPLTSASPAVSIPLNNLTNFCSNYNPTTPVVLDPLPDLVTGSSILSASSASNKLATGGRPVKGIAADGVAELLLRIPAQNPGDTITAQLFTDNCTSSAYVFSCSTASSIGDDGGLFVVNGTPILSNAIAFNASVTADANGFAYIGYRAPADFVHQLNPVPDISLSQRGYYINLVYTSSGGNYSEQTIPITIIRPLIILVHGYSTNAKKTWYDYPLLTDSRFKTEWVDYGSTTVDVAATYPAFPALTLPIDGSKPCPNQQCALLLHGSDLGFTYNTPVVANGIVNLIAGFNDGANPINAPVASSQVDVIAHSMGGLIARYWAVNNVTAPYLADSNYSQGYIHKLITLGTPNNGSPLATLSLLPQSTVARNLAAEVGSISISNATLLNGNVVNGAAGELSGDGIGVTLNSSLQSLNSASALVVTASIAGSITPVQTPAMSLIYQESPANDPLGSRYTPALYDMIFDPTISRGNPAGKGESVANDGAVPLTSALYDGSDTYPSLAQYDFCFPNVAHGAGTAIIVGGNDTLVKATGSVEPQVETLLNTSILNSAMWGLK